MEEERNYGDDMELVEVPVANRVDEMSVKNGNAVNFCVLNANDYYQTDLLV